MFWLFTNFNFLEYDYPTLIFLFEATTQRCTKGGGRRGHLMYPLKRLQKLGRKNAIQ
jgi:hypothetical protein